MFRVVHLIYITIKLLNLLTKTYIETQDIEQKYDGNKVNTTGIWEKSKFWVSFIN